MTDPALTYGRRYGLSALLSLATDDDDDGESAVAPRNAAPQVPKAAPQTDRPAAAPPAASAGAVPSCPKCAGAMWDNRPKNEQRVAEGKKALPSFACKDKEQCGGVVWSATGKDEPRQPKAPPKLPSFDDFALPDDADEMPF